MEIHAIGYSGSCHCLALSRQTTEDFLVPGLDGRNIVSVEKHMNVVHADWTGQRWITKHLDADSIRSLDVPLVRIDVSYCVWNIRGLPLGARSVDIFQHESKVIED